MKQQLRTFADYQRENDEVTFLYEQIRDLYKLITRGDFQISHGELYIDCWTSPEEKTIRDFLKQKLQASLAELKTLGIELDPKEEFGS